MEQTSRHSRGSGSPGSRKNLDSRCHGNDLGRKELYPSVICVPVASVKSTERLRVIINQAPNRFRRKRQIGDFYAERRERIFHGAGNGGRRRDGGAFARGFLAEGRERRRRRAVHDFDCGRFLSGAFTVVEVSNGQRLSFRTINKSLAEGD